MIEWGQLIITSFFTLFPIVNPIGGIPKFLAITDGDSNEHRIYQLKKACFYVGGILMAFLVAGELIMRFFGISLPAIRIAGGIILFRVAQNMLQAQPKYQQTQEELSEAVQKTDISFMPLAMPTLSGPGSISATLGVAAVMKHWYDYGAVILAIVAVSLSCWFILKASIRITSVLGVNGMNVFTRMMGFLTLCVSIQFIINGVLNILTNQTLLQNLFDVYRSLSP